MTEPTAEYLERSTDGQIELLRPAAHDAASRFGLDVAGIEVVAHAYNTTFAVDTTTGDRVALRLNTNSQSTPDEVVAQQAWQVAIATETDVVVPEPLLAADGTWFAEVTCEGFDRPLVATAASWLDGPDVGLDLPDVVAHALGRATASLHRQAAGWQLPPGSTMPTFDAPLFGDPDRLDTAPGLTNAQRTVIDEARATSRQAFERVYDGVSRRALHADLHGGNLKWQGATLAVFDFDDCGVGVPALDLAISAFYVRRDNPAAEDALRAGYAEVAPLPDIDPADHEALVAARQLLLLNSLLTSTTAELRAEAAAYAVTSVDRLAHWLTTGTFTLTPPPA